MKNILFIWIPKTAGTSLYECLKEKYNMPVLLDKEYFAFNNEGSVTFSHINVRMLIAEGFITKEYFLNCYPFAVIRNPYTRFISLYNDFKRSKRIAPDTTLKEFISVIGHFTCKSGLYNVRDYSQCASQVDWLLPNTHLIRFENLHSEIKWRFGIETLPHMNKETEGNHMDYYTPETLKMVTELYYDDFTLLNYDIVT